MPTHGEIWGILNYERLPHIRLFCGCVDHLSKNCIKALEGLCEEYKVNLDYEEWLRADCDKSILSSSCTMKNRHGVGEVGRG